jgi:hypothetical protein
MERGVESVGDRKKSVFSVADLYIDTVEAKKRLTTQCHKTCGFFKNIYPRTNLLMQEFFKGRMQNPCVFYVPL